MFYILAFIFGLVIGSFLNVCIYRLPLGLSVNEPKFSFCPHCEHRLYPLDLIPVLSFLFLKGKCRYCGEKVNTRYVLVELLTGLIFCITYYFYPSFQVLPLLFFVSGLIVLTFIDWEHQIIPDKLNIFLGVAGVVLVYLTGLRTLADMCLGFLVGFGLLYLICVLSRGGMGGGDIKLAGVMGIYLGWQLNLLALLMGFVLGGLAGVFLLAAKKKGRKSKVPFGPFLALGSILALFWGQDLITLYLQYAGFGG